MHTYLSQSQILCLDAVTAIEQGNLHALGSAMSKAQKSFDKGGVLACPAELVSPRLHGVMKNEKLREVSLAIKGVGSQGMCVRMCVRMYMLYKCVCLAFGSNSYNNKYNTLTTTTTTTITK
jgi:hypothetical protein